MHGGNDQPLIGIELQQLGDKGLHRAVRDRRRGEAFGGFDVFDDVGRVLDNLAVRRLHHRDHGPADRGQDDVAINLLGCQLLDIVHAAPVEIGARLARVIADVGAVQCIAGHRSSEGFGGLGPVLG